MFDHPPPNTCSETQGPSLVFLLGGIPSWALPTAGTNERTNCSLVQVAGLRLRRDTGRCGTWSPRSTEAFFARSGGVAKRLRAAAGEAMDMDMEEIDFGLPTTAQWLVSGLKVPGDGEFYWNSVLLISLIFAAINWCFDVLGCLPSKGSV